MLLPASQVIQDKTATNGQVATFDSTLGLYTPQTTIAMTTQTWGTVWAGPADGGTAAVPTFRNLTISDLPILGKRNMKYYAGTTSGITVINLGLIATGAPTYTNADDATGQWRKFTSTAAVLNDLQFTAVFQADWLADWTFRIKSRMAYMLGNSLPQTEIYQILQAAMGWKGAQETLHYFGSSLNPVISAPLQLGGGQEYFSGRSIGADVGDGDISAGEFVTNLVRPINEAKKIANSKSVGEGVARGLIGGRLQDFSEQRITSTRGRDLRDQAENIRRAITRAEATGKKAQSLKSRVRLLKVYEEAVNLGLDKEVRVPAWAKRTIGMLANTVPEE